MIHEIQGGVVIDVDREQLHVTSAYFSNETDWLDCFFSFALGKLSFFAEGEEPRRALCLALSPDPEGEATGRQNLSILSLLPRGWAQCKHDSSAGMFAAVGPSILHGSSS